MPLDFGTFKILALVLLLPPTPFLLLAGLAWLLRRRRFGTPIFILALLGLWFGATEAAGEWLTQHLLTPPSALVTERLPPAGKTAVLVLGGGVREWLPEYQGGGLKPVTAERLHYGVWLARRGGWPLAFSGGIGWAATDLFTPEAEIVARIATEDYRYALSWQESRSRDTRENAAMSLPLLASAGVRRVLLVTHDSHMRRSLRAFEAVAAPLGITIVAAPVGLVRDAYGSFTDWCPSNEGLARVRYAVYEWLAWQAGR